MLDKLINLFNLKHKPSQKEELIIDIINEMCKHPETDIMMAPHSNRYFLVNKKLEYWIKVSDFETTITNHKFTLNYVSSVGFNNILVDIISQSIERSRDEFEVSVFQNEMELLQKIKESVQIRNTF